MKTIKFFLLAMFMLVVNNVVATPVSGETGSPANAEVTQNTEELTLSLSNIYITEGHYEAKCSVLTKAGGRPSGNYSYDWSIEGDRCYIWPSGNSIADVSIYYSSAGRAIVHCDVYLSDGTLYKSLEYYIYY